ncbi:THAP domain-containing protein 5-like isoform X1 [Temnothorax americanus]|uniref:THAP domain-containing protein 5-like isoform X1 n=2 Tax=Temnothorax americanus TaxID=1964332 RepID=UPI0040684B45
MIISRETLLCFCRTIRLFSSTRLTKERKRNMTGCSADYCTNSSSKGFQMCRFPRVEKRRKVWIVNVNRADWVPGVSSTLCLIYFSDEMWEKTRGGKRRLTCTAVPTLFGDRLIHTSVQEEDEPKNIPENEHENFNNTSQEAQERSINNDAIVCCQYTSSIEKKI